MKSTSNDQERKMKRSREDYEIRDLHVRQIRLRKTGEVVGTVQPSDKPGKYEAHVWSELAKEYIDEGDYLGAAAAIEAVINIYENNSRPQK